MQTHCQEHTSPRLALSALLLPPVVSQKGLFSRRNQVGFRHHPVGIIINNTVVTLTILLMHSLLDPPEFFSGQLRQRGLNFQNCAHGKKGTKQTLISQPVNQR